MDDRIDTLGRIPLFSGLDRKALEAVAAAFQEAAFQGGETIIRDSDRSVSFYVLLEGKAEVKRGGDAIASIAPYDFFGELVALDFQRQRTAEVAAVEPCRCLMASQESLQNLILRNPTIGRKILGEIRSRYSENR